MDKCNHQWHVLASECAVCGKPIEEYIAELEAALKAEEETAVDLAENAEEDMKRIAKLEAQLKTSEL